MPKNKIKKHFYDRRHWYYFIFYVFFLFLIYCFACSFFNNFFNKSAQGSNFSVTSLFNFVPENTVSSSTEIIKVEGPKTNIFSTFFDSFANSTQIDATNTNLYRDDAANAIMFPPDYSWGVADNETVLKNQDKFINPNRRCLNGQCLEQRDNNLLFQDKLVTFPREIKKSDIVALTLGALDSKWLVGITLKDGKNYQGKVYYFSDNKFTPLLTNKKISSQYLGEFGFGGHDSDFLVIYGAYLGIAYRVQGNNITDISKFFDYRAMDKGFRPEVIRTSNGQITNWYIYSLSPDKSRFIKLWQNENQEISGETVYQDIFSENDAVSFYFLNASDSGFNFLARIKNSDNNYSWQIFSDQGFKNNFAGQLIFNPVLANEKITIEKLANSSLGQQNDSCPDAKFLFSADNKNWETLPLGYYLNQDFFRGPLEVYYLHVDFPAQTNKFYSPYLTEVLFDFYYQS